MPWVLSAGISKEKNVLDVVPFSGNRCARIFGTAAAIISERLASLKAGHYISEKSGVEAERR